MKTLHFIGDRVKLESKPSNRVSQTYEDFESRQSLKSPLVGTAVRMVDHLLKWAISFGP